MRKCSSCKNRCSSGYFGIEMCYWYEMTWTEEDEIKEASDCERYEEGNPSCLDSERYIPSSTMGDYSPSNPWDAPGMSIRDFI